MGNIFNEDFRDFLNALNTQEVKYVLVGGYSVIIHGYSRTTGDMDIWVERTEENYLKIEKAFQQFGMPLFDMTKKNFLKHPDWDVFTFGSSPVSIDIMVRVKGLNFKAAYKNSIFYEEDGLKIRTINKNNLVKAKKSTGRSKDLDDLENIVLPKK